MARLSNEDVADMHIAYDNARGAVMLYQEHFLNQYLPGYHMFANLCHRLRIPGSFNENRKSFTGPGNSVMQLRRTGCINVLHVLNDNNLHFYYFQKMRNLLSTDHLVNSLHVDA